MLIPRMVAIAFSLSGCVAVWGGASHVESEDASGGAIRYDHVVISERVVLSQANGICGKYQKTAAIEQERYGVVLPGGSIDELSFSCRAVHPQAAVQVSDVPGPVSTRNEPSEIPLQKEGGNFTVPVVVNKLLTLDFMVDSGASDVSIPADVVLTLMRLHSISSSDFLGKQVYRLADGSTVPSTRFRIRSLKVGNYELENVVGSIAGVEGALLLGQSFLGRFKSWSIDNQRHALILNQG